MKEDLKALNIKLIFKSMKTVLFIAPIIIISNYIYIKNFGTYEIRWDMEYILNYFSHETNKSVFAFLTFTALFFLCIALSEWILPATMTFIVKKKINDKEIIRKSNAKIEKILNKSIGFNPYNNTDSNAIFVSEFKAYSMISYPFITVMLWLFVWNTISAYIILGMAVLIFYLMAVSIKSLIK